VERLTKKELRALLEFIKECYPICELETFASVSFRSIYFETNPSLILPA
jgi:hypothetical protein